MIRSMFPRRFRALAALFVGATVLHACTEPPEPRREPVPDESSLPSHVGRDTCALCHPAEAEAWQGSHHDLAMEEATAETVLGDFDEATLTYDGVVSSFSRRDEAFVVRTDGPDGELADHRVAYTFGVDPLQQYLVAFEDGRYQATSLSWDTRPAS